MLQTTADPMEKIQYESPISYESKEILFKGDFNDKAGKISIKRVEKLSEKETREVLGTISKEDINDAETVNNVEDVENRTNKILNDVKSLNAIRFSERMVARLNAENDQTNEQAIYKMIIDSGNNVASLEDYLDKNKMFVNAMCAGAENLDTILEKKGVSKEVRLKVTQQSDTLIAKALSDYSVKQKIDDSGSAAFNWKTDVYTNIFLNDIQDVASKQSWEHIPGIAATKLLGVLNEYQKSADGATVLEISDESSSLARKLRGVKTDSLLERQAETFKTYVKQQNLDLYAQDKGYDTFQFSKNVIIGRYKGLVDENNIGIKGVDRISKQAFAESIFMGFLGPNTENTPYWGDSEFVMSFKKRVDEVLESKQVNNMLEIMNRIAHNFENVATEANIVTREDWLRVAVATIGKEVAIAASTKTNFELAINAPVNAIPSLKSQERQLQAGFARSLDFFREQMTEYLKNENKIQDKEFLSKLAFSLIDTVQKMKVCDNAGVVTVGRLIGQGEDYPRITGPDGKIKRNYLAVPTVIPANANGSKSKKKSFGFGIIETLFSVLIVGLIVAIVLLFIPLKKDDRQQIKDVDMISKAIEKYSVTNGGRLPMSITDKSTEICKTSATNCKGLIDLSILTQNEKYLISIPVNPLSEGENGTGYAIKRDTDGKIVITALDAL